MNNSKSYDSLELDKSSESNFSADSLEEIVVESKKCVKTDNNTSHYKKIDGIFKSDDEINSNDNNTLVPFHSCAITLAELKKIKKKARKKIKIENQTNRKVKQNLEFANDSISSDRNKLHLNLDGITSLNDNNMSKLSSNDTDVLSNGSNRYIKYNSSDKRLNSKTIAHTSRSSTLINKTLVEQKRGKSVSYLDQYRKKSEMKNHKRIGIKSASSAVGTINSSHCSQVSLIDLPESHSSINTDYCCSESEEIFYRDIISNKEVIHSSPRCSNGLEGSLMNDFINKNDEFIKKECELREKILKEDERIKKVLNEKEKSESKIKNKMKTKSPVKKQASNEDKLGSDAKAPKMELFLKRKEYGNNVSVKNRLEILQKREDHSLKLVEESKLVAPVPVTTYLLALSGRTDVTKKSQVSTNNKISVNLLQKEKEKLEDNMKNKIKGSHESKDRSNNENNEDATTEMMLRRHEFEKILAVKIRNNFLK